MARQAATITLILLLLMGASFAQRLASVLPAETIFAVGTEDVASHTDKLEPFIEEAERLKLADALSRLFGEDASGDAEAEEEFASAIPEALAEIDPLDLLGHDAWLAVSISSFNPMPAITLVARTAGDAGAHLGDAIRQAAEDEGAQSSSEGSVTIYEFTVEEDDSPFQVMALSQTNDVVVASTNPEVLRGVLRRLAGSGEAGFTSGDGYESTLGELGEANGYAFLDYEQLAAALQPLGTGIGYDLLIARALSGLQAIGTGGSIVSIEDDGLESASIRIPGAGDPALSALLVGQEPASRDPLQFVHPDALGVSVVHLDLPGWWNYLSELARSADELGNPDLDQMVMQFTGIDIRATLFDWMGTQAATITGELGSPVAPGVPSENLLGEVVYLLETTDEAAAGQGLSMLFGMAGGMVAGFADPSGSGAPAIEQRDSSGVQVTSFGIAPGVSVAYGVSDGWVLIGTSDEAIDRAFAARASGGGLQGELERLVGEIPQEATSFSLNDMQETLAQTGAQMAVQMQTFAGMSGGDIDFDALESAGTAIEEYFRFLAERAGGSFSYSVTEGAGVQRTYGQAEINW
ncbi:MAG: DUF3352 domain-containing protein [Trueperaceae bacterium]